MTRERMSVDQAALEFASETFVGWMKKPPESRFLGIDVREIIEQRNCNLHQIVCTRSVPEHIVIVVFDDSRNIIPQRSKNHFQISDLLLLTDLRILKVFPDARDTAQKDSRLNAQNYTHISWGLGFYPWKGFYLPDTLRQREYHPDEGKDCS